MHSFISFLLLAGDIAAAFAHPGALHTAKDFRRITKHVADSNEPWNTTWSLLTSSSYAQSSYKPNLQTVVYRGYNGVNSENYQYLYRDAAAAYQLAMRWKITIDKSYADASVNIMDSWAATITVIKGTSDKFLASGLYGHQLANAAELMRNYSGWSRTNKTASANMLKYVFATMKNLFFEDHNGESYYHYYAN